MVGHHPPKHCRASMYGTTVPTDSNENSPSSVTARVTRETILDILLNTPHSVTSETIAARANVDSETVDTHLRALSEAGAAHKINDAPPAYTANPADLPLEDLLDNGNAAEVFLLEARDKEYRQWFGVDDPYEATQPPHMDTETAVAALDQWFGIRKRLHQLTDEQTY